MWTHEAGGSRFMLVISIKTLYGGHSKQAAMVAAHCHAGAYNNRWTIVVDDDIDPTNFSDVIWAMCTRCDPRDQVDIIHGGWSSALDPMCYDTETDRRNSRVVIDACIPFRRKKTFPAIARSSKALDDRLRAKWARDLPKGFSSQRGDFDGRVGQAIASPPSGDGTSQWQRLDVSGGTHRTRETALLVAGLCRTIS